MNYNEEAMDSLQATMAMCSDVICKWLIFQYICMYVISVQSMPRALIKQ